MKVVLQQYNISQTNTIIALDSSFFGYIVNFTISEGKGPHVSEQVISHDICIELLEPLYGMGYHLYRDNWYTAVPLAETLLAENTNPTGTMHSNRKFLPPDIKKKLAKGDSVAFRKGKLL